MSQNLNPRQPRRDDATGRSGLFRRCLCAFDRACSRLLRLVIRLTGIMLALLLAVGLYLNLAGLPRGIIDRGLEHLRRNGLVVEVDSVRLVLYRGVTAQGLRFFESEEAGTPVLRAGEVSLSVNPLDWLAGSHGLSGLRVAQASICLDAMGGASTGACPRSLSLEDINIRLRTGHDGIYISGLNGTFHGIRIRGRGFVEFAAPAKGREKMSLERFSRTLSKALRNLPSWLPRATEEINTIRFEDAPLARFDFTIFPDRPRRSRVNAHVQGFGAQYHDVRYDAWEASARLRGKQLTVNSLSLRQGDRRADVTGKIDFQADTIEARAFTSLPPSSWMGLIPDPVRRKMARTGFSFHGPISCELWLGPAPLREAFEHFTGWLSLEKASLKNIWVERAFLSFQRQGNYVDLVKVDAVIGKAAAKGHARGKVRFQVDTRQYWGEAEGSLDPKDLVPIMNRKQTELVNALAFRAGYPVGRLKVHGVIGRPRDFSAEGFMQGSNLVFRGAEGTYVEAAFTLTNQVMDVSPGYLVRPEGTATGRLVMDFRNEIVDVDAAGTMDPIAVAMMIGPKTEKFIRNFRLEAPAKVRCKGRIDYSGYEQTDFEAHAEGTRMGLKWLVSDECSFDVRAFGTRLDFTNVQGRAHGGAFTGKATFTSINETNNVHYDIAGVIEKADFESVIRAFRGHAGPYKGQLSADFNIRGVLGVGKGDTVRGEGNILIKDGYLFQIPLLGGLSQMLSKIYPRLGFATQTDFTSTFTIADRKFHSEDAYLEGPVLSVSGTGDYYFNDKLDVKVQVKLLRKGAIAAVLRLVTFPVTKLLEFHLGGTTKKPEWRPVNLPKELFFIFD